jgi:hypothetical protein
MGPIGGPTPRWTGRQTVGRNITSTWTCVIALQITDPSSCQRGCPTRKRKKVIVTQRNVTSGHPFQKGHNTKTKWPTDRQSQHNLNFNLNYTMPLPSNDHLFWLHYLTFQASHHNMIFLLTYHKTALPQLLMFNILAKSKGMVDTVFRDRMEHSYSLIWQNEQ